MNIVRMFANMFLKLITWPVMSLESKNWPFVGVWTPKSEVEHKLSLPEHDPSSLQVDEIKQNELKTKTLDDLMSKYVPKKLHTFRLLFNNIAYASTSSYS